MECKYLSFFNRFVKHPEYLKTGQRLVFREGRTKAVGSVTKIIPHVSTLTQGPGQSKGHHKGMKPQQQQQPNNVPSSTSSTSPGPSDENLKRAYAALGLPPG